MFQGLLKGVEHLKLLFRLQVVHLLQQLLRSSGADEAGDVDVDEGGHQELTVEAVHDAAVPGDHVSEVLDLEGPLESGSEETTERSNH